MRPASAPPISEKDWARTVVEYAELMGWKVYRTWLSVRSPAGFPDLVMARERLVCAELKSENGFATSAQLGWLAAISTANVEAYIWRPSDWDEVQRVLGR